MIFHRLRCWFAALKAPPLPKSLGLEWVSPTLGQLPVLHGPEIPVSVSLTVVGLLLVGSIVLSIVYPKPDESEAA